MFRILFPIVTIASLSLISLNADARFTTKIVGGVEADKGELPFMVSLQDSGGHFCGGSLIAKDWVLTAAHCVVDGGPTSIHIGLNDHTAITEGETFRPAQIIANPQYNASTTDFDYALIRLDGVSKYEPIKLSHADPVAPVSVTTAGWGYEHEGSYNLPQNLRKVTMPLVSRAQCNVNYKNKITDRMVCAGLDAGGKDSCQGDSGGPLFTGTGANRVLVGIVSWGEGCARAHLPGIYSNVSAGRDWIRSVSGI